MSSDFLVRVLNVKVSRVGKLLALVLMLLMTARTLAAFPGFPPVQEGWNVVCLLYLLCLFPWLKTTNERNISRFEWYLLTLIVVVPVWTGLCAFHAFGQPFLYGALAARAIILLAGVLFIVRAVRNQQVTPAELESALLILAWGLAGLFIAMRLFLNPASFTGFVGFAMAGDSASAAHFTLQAEFILFGAIYYALRGVRTGRATNYLLSIVLLAGAIDQYGGREMIAALLLTFLFFVFRWSSPRRLLIRLPQLVLGFAALLALLYAVMPAVVSERVGKFRDAFAIVVTRNEVEDTSANWHFLEVLYAVPAIEQHPLVGNGRVSNQWAGGGDEVRGVHFYPEDVGLFGVLYQFGIFGMVLFGCQYWFAIRTLRGTNPGRASPLLDATKGFLLYSVLLSAGYGMFVFQAPLTLFFIGLLLAISNQTGPRDLRNQPSAVRNHAGTIRLEPREGTL